MVFDLNQTVFVRVDPEDEPDEGYIYDIVDSGYRIMWLGESAYLSPFVWREDQLELI